MVGLFVILLAVQLQQKKSGEFYFINLNGRPICNSFGSAITAKKVLFQIEGLSCMFNSGMTLTQTEIRHTPSSNLPGVQTHYLLIMDSTFHIPEALALTTEPSGTPTSF